MSHDLYFPKPLCLALVSANRQRRTPIKTTGHGYPTGAEQRAADREASRLALLDDIGQRVTAEKFERIAFMSRFWDRFLCDGELVEVWGRG